MQGLSRTNYFRVKDAAMFQSVMARFDVTVVKNEAEDLFGIISDTDHGGFPSQYVFQDDHLEFFLDTAEAGFPFLVSDREALVAHMTAAAANAGITICDVDMDQACDVISTAQGRTLDGDDFYDVDVEFCYLLTNFLVDGEILVYTCTGYDKGRYGWGCSVAIRAGDNESIRIDIGDIYDLAKQKFGTTPTEATY